MQNTGTTSFDVYRNANPGEVGDYVGTYASGATIADGGDPKYEEKIRAAIKTIQQEAQQ